eukprot:1999626-Amphidinium_carterae.1
MWFQSRKFIARRFFRWRLDQLNAVRGAKILRWECDSALAREMDGYREAEDFLSFCLENADTFTPRDWIASLTLLTTRRKKSTAHPLFHRYSQRILKDAEGNFAQSVHLLLHRYGVLGYAPAVWKLLPLLTARLPLMSPKQVAISSWSLGRVFINETQVWEAIGEAFQKQPLEYSLTDLAMIAWAFAAVDRAAPQDVIRLKECVRAKLMGKAVEGVASHDVCMLMKAIAKVTPQDKRFIEWMLLLMTEGMADKSMSFTAQGLTTLWSVMASLSWKPDAEILEAMCEESRVLRLDHTFNQDMAAELAKALMKLDVADARPEYQIVDYVARKGLALRADTLLVLAEFLAIRGVSAEKPWKRLGVRAQQRAVDLRLEDIDRLEGIFRRSGRGNERIYGMLLLFRRIRQDLLKYGPA